MNSNFNDGVAGRILGLQDEVANLQDRNNRMLGTLKLVQDALRQQIPLEKLPDGFRYLLSGPGGIMFELARAIAREEQR